VALWSPVFVELLTTREIAGFIDHSPGVLAGSSGVPTGDLAHQPGRAALLAISQAVRM